MDEPKQTDIEERQPLPPSLTEIPGSLIAMNPPQENALPLDAAVVRRAMTRDREAFTQLFYQTYRYVYVVVAAVLPNDEDRHDAVQETYLRVALPACAHRRRFSRGCAPLPTTAR